jgi:TonB-dependent SusC/RagA subfamily outer membrane receptor
VTLGLLLFGAVPAQAQSAGTVTGRVVDAATQQPLVGAQVSVVGTPLGGLANASGTFLILNVPAGSHTVRVQMIGHVSQERQVTVTAGQAVSVDFALAVSAIALDEVVVTGTSGAGQTRRTLGNSISSVKAAEITEVAPIADVRQLLQGRSPGVTLTNSTGVVGGGSRLQIRGSGSLNAGNEPVVFVDGIRVQSGQSRTESNTSQPINLLDAFNPQDIESIEVIKGPAAATLYGAEAAAGVIQIITKKGRASEGVRWSANVEYGRVEWAKDHQIKTYWLCNDARMNNLNANPGCGAFTKDMPLEERLLVDYPLDPSRRSLGVKHQYEQKGWTEDFPCLFPQQAPCDPNPIRTGESRSMNLSVRGGGDAYNFYLSGEKSDQDGTFYNNYSDRAGVRANFGFFPTEKLSLSASTGYVRMDQQLPQSDNSSNSVLRNTYRGQAGGPAGQYLPGYRNYHPEFSNKYGRHVEQERLTMSLTTQYRPYSWWTNKLVVGLDRRESQNITGNQIDQTGGILYSGNSAGGSVNISTSKVWLWSIDYSGTATHDLNDDWASSLSAGMQLTRRRSESYGISGSGFAANSMNLVSSAAIRSSSQGFSEQTGLGFYVQEQMGWRNRVFATGAVRFDDNSAFGNEFTIVVYPKASLAWVISDEDFFDVSWVDQLKLRTAWGRAGNAPSPFSAERTYSAGRAVIGDDAVNVLSTGALVTPT